MTSHLQSPVFVSADAAKSVFRWTDAVAALQAVYGRSFEQAATPPRTVAAAGGAWLRSLPAIPPGSRCFGAKLMGASMGTPNAGVEYVIVLFDKATSRIVAFLDAALVTGYRTAATSAAALDRLAPQGSARLCVLGSGLEASMHTRAFASVRPLSEILVFSPTAERREAFAHAATQDLGVPVRAVSDPQAAVAGSDIVLTAARSRGEKPILFGDWLKPDATVVSIGSTIPQQREIDASVVARADLIVCDMLEEVLHETGDMIAARQAGIDVQTRAFSLDALMRGEIAPQREAARIRMFKSVGGGLQDVVVAELILEQAIAAGLATPLPIAFEHKQI